MEQGDQNTSCRDSVTTDDRRREGEPGFAVVTAVSRSGSHSFSKFNETRIRLVAGLGVEGDAHLGLKTQHIYQMRKDPNAPNLRQVHLIHEELFQELKTAGFDVAPGAIGENVTTRGLDLLQLPRGTRLRLGAQAVIELTGLRNPCRQLDAFASGLTAAVLERDAEGRLIRKAGVMAIVIEDGDVRAGDSIVAQIPAGEKEPLAPV
jgi:MOSC domain-containing protein YiiM